jgi:hypothetical protein
LIAETLENLRRAEAERDAAVSLMNTLIQERGYAKS